MWAEQRKKLGPVSELSRLALRLDELAVDQNLGDLHCVQRGALAEVVADHPEHQPVVDRRVFADAADVGGVFAERNETPISGLPEIGT